MKNCENCMRKEIENNNIRKKALNDINEVDHINFQTGNKIEKLKLKNFRKTLPKFLQVLFFRQFLVRVFESRKYSEEIRRN